MDDSSDVPAGNRPVPVPPTAAGHSAPGLAGQGELFPDLRPQPDADLGYRVPTVLRAAGITYRQLDYWARTGLVLPSVRDATGSGSQRLYSFRDVVVLRIVKKLLDAGVSLHNVRAAVAHLRARGAADLSQMTLVSDGSTVYECTSSDEVYDLLQEGQAVLQVVPVARTLAEVEGTLAQFPGERTGVEPTTGPTTGPTAGDELAQRRRRRSAG